MGISKRTGHAHHVDGIVTYAMAGEAVHRALEQSIYKELVKAGRHDRKTMVAARKRARQSPCHSYAYSVSWVTNERS